VKGAEASGGILERELGGSLKSAMGALETEADIVDSRTYWRNEIQDPLGGRYGLGLPATH